MVSNDITVTLKTPGELKSRQGTKSKNAAGDDAAFGQALASASAGTADYRDDGVETTPGQDKQGVSTETSVNTVSSEPAEGISAVIPEGLGLAETMQMAQAVQAGKLVQSILAGGESSEETLPGDATLFSAEMGLIGQDVGEVAETVRPEGVDMQTVALAAETVGQGETLAGAAKEKDVVTDVRAAGREATRPGEGEEFAADREEGVQKADPASLTDTMVQASAAGREEGRVHKQTSVNDGREEKVFKSSEVKTENYVAEGADGTYMQRMTAEQVARPQSNVTQTGEMREEYADMLKDMIARQISQGKQELEISLTPRSLGKLIVKVAFEAGETTVSIICSNQKAMNAMSQKAGELGRILEDSLGTKMEVVVETEKPDSYLQQDGRNANSEQGEQERQSNQEQKKSQEADAADFLQQLRLGLA